MWLKYGSIHCIFIDVHTLGYHKHVATAEMFFPHVESFDIRKTVIKTTLRLHKYHLVASR